ncbi:MAG: DUF4190 domain-containing protein [Nocardioidaceae bacterium]|nr:DUF4190 domain-containing protein [Nocardioidaceae bacterium]
MTEPPEFPPPAPTPPPPSPGQQPLPSYGQQPPPPPYGAPPAYQPPRKTGTNGFAIASLVFGIIGGCLLGLIFGIVALNQIKKNGQQGRGMAIAGIVLSVLWFLVIVVLGVVGAMDSAERDEKGTITDSGQVNSKDLEVGDCIRALEETKALADVPAVPCAEPHRGEVYAVVQLPGVEYPSEATFDKQSGQRCSNQLKKIAPAAFRDPKVDIFYVYPLERSWAAGDHEVTCIATTTETRTGSIKD